MASDDAASSARRRLLKIGKGLGPSSAAGRKTEREDAMPSNERTAVDIAAERQEGGGSAGMLPEDIQVEEDDEIRVEQAREPDPEVLP